MPKTVRTFNAVTAKRAAKADAVAKEHAVNAAVIKERAASAAVGKEHAANAQTGNRRGVSVKYSALSVMQTHSAERRVMPSVMCVRHSVIFAEQSVI
jgi:hypothetical protein